VKELVASRGQARAVAGVTYSRRRAWTARGPPADGGAHALAWAGAGGGARVLAWACAVEPATRESHGLSFGGRGCRLAARGGEERRLARRKETFGANVCFLSGMMGNFLQLYEKGVFRASFGERCRFHGSKELNPWFGESSVWLDKAEVELFFFPLDMEL